MTIETQTLDNKILQYVKSLTSKTARREKGEFWNIYNDKTVCSWGWTEPLRFDTYRIVYLSFSPTIKGGENTVVFDYITDSEYKKNN